MRTPSLVRLLFRDSLVQSIVWLAVGGAVLSYLLYFVHNEDLALRRDVAERRKAVSKTGAQQLLLLESAERAGDLFEILDEIEYELWRAWRVHQQDVKWVRLCDVSENVLIALSSPDAEASDSRNPKIKMTIHRWPIMSERLGLLHTVAVLELGFSSGVSPSDALLKETSGLWSLSEGRIVARPDGNLLSFLRKTNELENSLKILCEHNANLGLLFIDVRGRLGGLVASTTSGAFWEPQSEKERRDQVTQLGLSDVQKMSIAHRGFVRGTMESGWSKTRGGLAGMEPLLKERMRNVATICLVALILAFGVGLVVQSILVYKGVRRISSPLLRLAENVRSFATRPDSGTGQTIVVESGRIDPDYAEVQSLATDFAEMKRQIKEILAQKDRAYSELEENQRAMRQRARLATLGELGAGVAHELNNKLNPARLRIGELLMDLERGGTVQKEDVLFLLRQVDEIAGFVGRFKNFAKPQMQTQTQCDPKQIIEASISLLRGQLTKANVVIEAELDASPEILANEVELEQVFVNLFLNARDAIQPTIKGSKQHGTIRVHCWEQAEKACVSVSDDGVGMDDDVKRRIFMPFFTTKGVQGTGLGLAITQEILQRHHAEVQIESQPGKGTTFTMRFPNANAPRPEPLNPMKDSLKDWPGRTE